MNLKLYIMEQLKLEHLVGYLEHELQTNFGKLTGIRNWLGWCGTFKADFGENNIPISAIKPYLRPLSDLTKEIEHNGDKFVPIKELCKKAIDYYDFKENCFISDDIVEFSFTNNNSISAHYEDDLKFVFTYSVERFLFSLYTPQRLEYCFGANYVNKLQSWHFDIHGLIEKGQAIDINTIKQ